MTRKSTRKRAKIDYSLFGDGEVLPTVINQESIPETQQVVVRPAQTGLLAMFPVELILEILKLLPPEDLLSAAVSCRKLWISMTKFWLSDTVHWENYIKEHQNLLGSAKIVKSITFVRYLSLLSRTYCEICKFKNAEIVWSFKIRCCSSCLYANTISGKELVKDGFFRDELLPIPFVREVREGQEAKFDYEPVYNITDNLYWTTTTTKLVYDPDNPDNFWPTTEEDINNNEEFQMECEEQERQYINVRSRKTGLKILSYFGLTTSGDLDAFMEVMKRSDTTWMREIGNEIWDMNIKCFNDRLFLPLLKSRFKLNYPTQMIINTNGVNYGTVKDWEPSRWSDGLEMLVEESNKLAEQLFRSERKMVEITTQCQSHWQIHILNFIRKAEKRIFRCRIRNCESKRHAFSTGLLEHYRKVHGIIFLH